MNKTFWVVSNLQANSVKVAHNIKQTLTKSKWKVNEKSHDYLFVVGGDGTFVRFLRNYYDKHTKIVCINSGTVGFYSKFISNKLANFIKIISDDKNYTHPQVLEISINNKKKYNAMNELVIQSLNTIRMDVSVDNYLYERFMGTGILVATHTGATGQAKSNGGPIILPSVDAYELIELAPTNHSKHHSFNVPLIMNSSSNVVLNKFQSAQRCDLIIDGMRVMSIKPTDQIKVICTKAKFALCFDNQTNSYINKLNSTFIKG